MKFDFTEKEAIRFIEMLNKNNIDYDIGYIFDDKTDEEIGYSIMPCGEFAVKYDKETEA